MNPLDLIPAPDTIPAPAWLFLVLDILLFLLHIVMINVMLGSVLITIFSRFKRDANSPAGRLHDAAAAKIPVTFALGINLGVAPLLFLQVIYGHLFYASSVLMAVFWILIIPLLIIAYYGAYIHIRKYGARPLLSKAALGVTAILVLYIALMFTNNMTLMLQPEKWTDYFSNRAGTMLNFSDPTLIPRYLHFLFASVAIGGIFMALVWNRRGKKGNGQAGQKEKTGLQIFGYATIGQIIIGLWFLIALPREYMLQFMGGNMFATIIFLIGFLAGLGTLATAFAGKLRPTLIMLAFTLLAMVIQRHNLREMYLANKFELTSLQLNPQYGVMIIFFIVLIIGLASVGYMLKLSFSAKQGRAA